MTFNLYVILLVALSAISSLLTEAIKQFLKNKNENAASANLIALIDAVVVGGAGSVCAYLILGIPFNCVSIVAIIAMVGCIWIGSMIGYDKIIQLVKQIGGQDTKEE